MSAPTLLLWTLAGRPAIDGEEAIGALVAAAERHLRSGGVFTAEEAAGLTEVERAAVLRASRRVEAARALLFAKAMRGGADEAEVMALVDREAAESMLLSATPIQAEGWR